MTSLVLASTSPARLTLLRNAGIEPIVIAPGVDEPAVASRAQAAGLIGSVPDLVQLLAKAKGEAVANNPDAAGHMIIACDSSLELDGISLGKPHLPEVAKERWRAMRGRSGTLHTGHWLIDNRNPVAGQLPPATGLVTSTVVHFADLSDAEIDRYVDTGEPLQVAGAFTIDARGGAFIRAIEGDPHSVVGLSLAALRLACQQLGVEYTSLWA